jgi:type IV pilus assembly protein PilX
MRRQRGMVLILVLVVLVIVLVAGMSALRSVQSGNTMAGNFAFRAGAVQASDRAVDDALTTIANQVSGGQGNTAVANRYLSTIDPTVNTLGVPVAIDWTAVPCVDEKGAVVANCSADSGNYRVQYVVERRCSANPDFLNILEIRALCEYEPSTAAVSAATIALRYRVLVRVRGPRGTESWFEAMVSGPAAT